MRLTCSDRRHGLNEARRDEGGVSNSSSKRPTDDFGYARERETRRTEPEPRPLAIPFVSRVWRLVLVLVLVAKMERPGAIAVHVGVVSGRELLMVQLLLLLLLLVVNGGVVGRCRRCERVEVEGCRLDVHAACYRGR